MASSEESPPRLLTVVTPPLEEEGPSSSQGLEKTSSGSYRVPLLEGMEPMCRREDGVLVGKKEVVSDGDVLELLEHFMESAFDVSARNDKFSIQVQETCEKLFRKDYKCSLIRNTSGLRSKNYPYNLIYLDRELTDEEKSSTLPDDFSGIMSETAADVCEAIDRGSYARKNKKFPIPVMMYKNQLICRSGGVASGSEIQLRKHNNDQTEIDIPKEDKKGDEETSDSEEDTPKKKRWSSLDVAAHQDILLLRKYNIFYICDLMLEKRNARFYSCISSKKNLWFTMYSSFCLLHTPYPDHQFFSKFSEKGSGVDVLYEWTNTNSKLKVPEGYVDDPPKIRWTRYKKWDLLTLTLNYVKMLLSTISSSRGALLIQCLYGIDRTPLFISLLRLSMWADGLIHKSLTPVEIAYLVVAYDWYLFGHNLPERLSKSHEVMSFFFTVLSFLEAEQFSMHECVKKWVEELEKKDDKEYLPDDTKDVTEMDIAEGTEAETKDDNLTEGERQNAFFDEEFRLAQKREIRQATLGPRRKCPQEPSPEEREAIVAEREDFHKQTFKQFSIPDLERSVKSCACSSANPVNSPSEVLIWRQEKLKLVQIILTANFSVAASGTVYSRSPTPPRVPEDRMAKWKKDDPVPATPKLTIFRFFLRDLCPSYRRLKEVLQSQKEALELQKENEEKELANLTELQKENEEKELANLTEM